LVTFGRRVCSSINYHSDYGENELLDTYSNAGLNDEELFEPMSTVARHTAETKMQQHGMRAATWSHAPCFFNSDDMGAEDDNESGLLSRTHACVHWQYDEWRDIDMEGIGDVRFPLHPLHCARFLYSEKEVPLEQLSRHQSNIDH
jgi:DNA replication licensing factor MCM2